MEYRIGNVEKPGVTPETKKDEALKKLHRRAKRYDGPWFRKRQGRKYIGPSGLNTAIDWIEKDMNEERPDSDLDRWFLRNKDGVRLFIAEAEILGPKPSVGTCPLVDWHQEAWGKFKGLYTLGIYNCRSIGGTSSPSQHSYANAEDPAHNDFSIMKALWEWTVENEGRLHVAHAIFNRKIWSYNYGYVRPYSGENPHTNHVHVDFLPQLSGSCRASQCR